MPVLSSVLFTLFELITLVCGTLFLLTGRESWLTILGACAFFFNLLIVIDLFFYLRGWKHKS